MAALGAGGRTTDARGALEQIGAQPFGEAMLVLMAAGLFAYALWRIMEGVLDTDAAGKDAKGWARRAGMGVSGLAHGGLVRAPCASS